MATTKKESPAERLSRAEHALKAAKVAASEHGWYYANHSREEEERLDAEVKSARAAVREENRARKPKKPPVMSQRKMLMGEREALTRLLDKERLKLDCLQKQLSDYNAQRLYDPDPLQRGLAKIAIAELTEDWDFIPRSKKNIEEIEAKLESIDFKLEQQPLVIQ